MLDEIQKLKSKELHINSNLNTLISAKIDLYKDKIVKVLIFTPYNHAMGSLAMGPSSIYNEINLNPNTPGIADRMFFYDFLYDKDGNLDDSFKNILSIDNNFSINDFDIIATGLTNPGSFLDILKFFNLSGIPRNIVDRDLDFPLIIGGGIGFSNPIPYSKYFDLFTYGESEKQFVYIVNEIHKLKKIGFKDWKNYIKNESRIYKGIYSPSFRNIISNYKNNTLNIISNFNEKKIDIPDDILLLDNKHRFSSQIVIDNTGVIVVNKGCYYSCNFCQLSNGNQIGLPLDDIKKSIDSLFENGINKLIINSPSFTQYKFKKELLDYILFKKNECKVYDFQLFVGSVRVDELDEEYIDQLIAFNSFNHTYLKYTEDEKSNFIAVAPDFGNERLMKLMNKGLKMKDVLDGIALSNKKGIHNFHLYFMVGVESETQEDRKDIARLTREIYNLVKSNNGKLYLKINLYIPSVNTVGQRMKMYNTNDYKTFISDIINELENIFSKDELKNIELITLDEWNVILQSFLMRGDESVTDIIEYIYDNKVSLEGLNYILISDIFQKFGLNYDDFLEKIDENIILPWDELNQIHKYSENKLFKLINTNYESMS